MDFWYFMYAMVGLGVSAGSIYNHPKSSGKVPLPIRLIAAVAFGVFWPVFAGMRLTDDD